MYGWRPPKSMALWRLHYSPLPPSLLLKVVLTPALIATATLVGRRWGGTMSGWLVGLPLTSAPVVFFLALDQGTAFATTASLAVLLGTISQAAFAVAYARVAIRTGWLPAAAAGSAVFAVATIAFQQVSLPALPAYGAVLVSLVIGIVFIPRRERPAATDAVPPDWDLPVRIVLATGLVGGQQSAQRSAAWALRVCQLLPGAGPRPRPAWHRFVLWVCHTGRPAGAGLDA